MLQMLKLAILLLISSPSVEVQGLKMENQAGEAPGGGATAGAYNAFKDSMASKKQWTDGQLYIPLGNSGRERLRAKLQPYLDSKKYTDRQAACFLANTAGAQNFPLFEYRGLMSEGAISDDEDIQARADFQARSSAVARFSQDSGMFGTYTPAAFGKWIERACGYGKEVSSMNKYGGLSSRYYNHWANAPAYNDVSGEVTYAKCRAYHERQWALWGKPDGTRAAIWDPDDPHFPSAADARQHCLDASNGNEIYPYWYGPDYQPNGLHYSTNTSTDAGRFSRNHLEEQPFWDETPRADDHKSDVTADDPFACIMWDAEDLGLSPAFYLGIAEDALHQFDSSGKVFDKSVFTGTDEERTAQATTLQHSSGMIGSSLMYGLANLISEARICLPKIDDCKKVYGAPFRHNPGTFDFRGNQWWTNGMHGGKGEGGADGIWEQGFARTNFVNGINLDDGWNDAGFVDWECHDGLDHAIQDGMGGTGAIQPRCELNNATWPHAQRDGSFVPCQQDCVKQCQVGETGGIKKRSTPYRSSDFGVTIENPLANNAKLCSSTGNPATRCTVDKTTGKVGEYCLAKVGSTCGQYSNNQPTPDGDGCKYARDVYKENCQLVPGCKWEPHMGCASKAAVDDLSALICTIGEDLMYWQYMRRIHTAFIAFAKFSGYKDTGRNYLLGDCAVTKNMVKRWTDALFDLVGIEEDDLGDYGAALGTALLVLGRLLVFTTFTLQSKEVQPLTKIFDDLPDFAFVQREVGEVAPVDKLENGWEAYEGK